MKKIDGPKTTPIVQLVQWIADPIGFLESNAKCYGDIFKAYTGSKSPLVFISNPKVIQEIFSADADLFKADLGNDSAKTVVGENSLLVLNGTHHTQRRKLLMPQFHGSRIQEYGKLICDITQQVISQWERGVQWTVRTATQEITMQVILQAVFGLNEGAGYWQIKEAIEALQSMTSSPLKASLVFLPFLQKDLGAWSPWGRFVRCQKRVDNLLYTEIRERRQNIDPSRTDILTLLLLSRYENGESMTDRELRDELITLLIGGHETTATAMSWALYWIHKFPEIKQKLQAELDNLSDDPDPETIFKLPYLTAICQETLRMYPVSLVSFSRVPKFDYSLRDYQFDAGTMLTPCIYLTHHREDLYPNPKQFRPERFLERQYSPYEYLPFGGGNRRCIGMALAQYEMKLAIATILKNLELALPDDKPVRPVRRGLTIAPSDNLRLVVTGRRTPNQTPTTATVG